MSLQSSSVFEMVVFSQAVCSLLYFVQAFFCAVSRIHTIEFDRKLIRSSCYHRSCQQITETFVQLKRHPTRLGFPMNTSHAEEFDSNSEVFVFL